MKIVRMMMVTAALFYGCGGSDSGTPTTPTQPNNPTPVATTTITITAAGVTPQVITVSTGSRVTFINNDSRSHEMHSDPHPQHGDCPAIDEVGFLPAGGLKQTGVFTAARTCGFHDHNLPDIASLRGRLIVQSAGAGLRVLPAAELRFPFLHARRDPLARIVTLEQALLKLALE